MVRIFTEYLAGRGLFAIAEGLTHDGIPCPSAHDRGRNRHRCGIAWSKGAVKAILANPKYTGRQVWNRQRKDEVLLDIEDVTLGHITKMRWSNEGQWIYSEKIAHTPIIDDQTLLGVQEIMVGRGRGSCEHKPHRSRHSYVFKGALYCGLCQRKMQSQWINKAPYYRCKFAEEYALANGIDHPKNVYLREDAILDRVDDWLAENFAPDRITATIEAMTAAQDTDAHDARTAIAQAKINDAAIKMARHRAALEAGGDVEEINEWIAETKAQRLGAEAELRSLEGRTRMTREQITELVEGLGEMVTALPEGDPDHKAEVYRQIGLKLTYYPRESKVRAEVCLNPQNIVKRNVSEDRHGRLPNGS